MRTLLSGFFLCLILMVHGQHCDWMALTDCGNLVNVRQLCTDDHGNVYTAGEYQGEILFHSANHSDTAITKFTDEYWHKTYVAKYDSTGRLLLVVQFKSSGSNSDLTYVEGLKTLPNGNFVVFVMSNGGFFFVGPKGNHVTTGKNGYGGNLYCIDAKGNLVWSTNVPVEHCNCLAVAANGTICVCGNERYYSNYKIMAVYTTVGNLSATLHTGGIYFVSVCTKDSKMYALGINGLFSNQKSDAVDSVFTLPAGYFGLYEVDLEKFTVKRKFACALPQKQNYKAQSPVTALKANIHFVSGEPVVDLLWESGRDSVVFLDRKYRRNAENMHLTRLSQDGKLLASKDFSAGYYNYNITSSPDGFVYLFVVGWGNYFRLDDDSLALPSHAEFINELVLVELDDHFEKVNWCTAGATASNYHTSLLTPGRAGGIFVLSDQLSSGETFGRNIDIPWSTVSYLAFLRE